MATPLELTMNFPLGAPLKVVLVIHSIRAALTVECAPAQGCPGTPPYGVPEVGMHRGALEQPSHSMEWVAQSSCTSTLLVICSAS